MLKDALIFIIALSLLVVVHEYGHYWMARRFGVRVLSFSVGFGKPLFTWVRGVTQFHISAIPLGGYVKLLDRREGDVPEADMPEEFSTKPVLQRMAVFAAGPVVNLLFAFLLDGGLYTFGNVVDKPMIYGIDAQSLAERSGLRESDEVLSVDGKPAEDWESVIWALVDRIGDSGSIQLEILSRDASSAITKELPVQQFLKGEKEIHPLKAMGIQIFPKILPLLGEIKAGSAAEKAGLKSGDLVVQVNNQPIDDWLKWVDLIRLHPQKTMEVIVKRQGELVTLSVTPALVMVDGKEVAQVGVGLQMPKESSLQLQTKVVQYSFLTAGVRALTATWDRMILTVETMGKMFTGLVSVKNLSGPVTIATLAADSAEAGWQPFIKFLAYISISLGVLNLLPIPMLDGGHILYAVIEWVTKRPLSDKVQRLGFNMGLVFLMMMMSIAFYNDIVRLLS